MPKQKTGCGTEPPEMGPLEAQVLANIPNVMPTIDVSVESDIVNAKVWVYCSIMHKHNIFM